MTKLGVTQLFYDGACKKLSLVGSSSADVHILSQSPPKAEQSSNATPSLQDAAKSQGPLDALKDTAETNNTAETAPTSNSDPSILKEEATVTNMDANDKTDNEEGTLGSSSENTGAPSCHALEYSLWTFGELKILIRNRIHEISTTR